MKKEDRFTYDVQTAQIAGRQSWLAYPFRYDLPNRFIGEDRSEWRVWRPDRVPHHFGHYATQERAIKSANRINRALYGEAAVPRD